MKIKKRFNSLHGIVVKGDSVANFTLTETAYGSGVNLPEHNHGLPYFCFVLTGGFTESNKRKSQICRPSALIFHPADESHANSFHVPTHCFNLQMNENWIERLRRNSVMVETPAEFHGGVLPQLAAKVYREFCRKDELSPLIVEGLMLEIFGEMSRQSKKHSDGKTPGWLVTAREILHDRFLENLSLAEIAQTVGVHETHLAREFRRYYRCTVGEYLRQLRIESASRRLSDSDAPITEIALTAGFFDQSHFGKTFKHFTGMSPAAYRKIFRVR